MPKVRLIKLDIQGRKASLLRVRFYTGNRKNEVMRGKAELTKYKRRINKNKPLEHNQKHNYLWKGLCTIIKIFMLIKI